MQLSDSMQNLMQSPVERMNPMENPLQHLKLLQQSMMESSHPTPEQTLEALSMMQDPEDEDEEDDEACAQANIQQILQYNIALRQNFEELKQLHLQLTDANLHVHEARIRLQQEKEALEKAMEKAAEQASADITELKLEKERLLSTIDDLKLSQEEEKRVLKRERDESIAKVEGLENHIQNLEKKMLTSKVENDELVIQMGKIRAEMEEAMTSKHCIDMVHSRDLMALKVEDLSSKQIAVDLAHKCKHLELDLEKSMNAAEAAHQELLTFTFERDSTITNLKDSLRRMEEDMFAQQEQRKKTEQDWECERKRLMHTIESKEWQMLRSKEEAEARLKEDFELRLTLLQKEKEESERLFREEADLCIKEALMDLRYEEEKQRDLRRTLEGEAADLRAMLSAMEQASTDAETRHTKTIKELTKEGTALCKELSECKEKEKEDIEALKCLRKENSELLSEIEGLRAQLDDALTKNHQFYTEIGDYRRALDEYERQAEHLKIELHDLEKCRERDQQDHVHILENAKRNWATEKVAIILKETKLGDERHRALTDKNQSLKKKLKETNKLLATTTADHNQLMIRTREIETQLALAQPNRMMYAAHPSDHQFMPRSGKFLDRSCGNATWLRTEMAQLEKRQSQFLSRGEQSHAFKADMGSHIPQRCQDSSMPEKEMEDERSRDGIASLMKAADLDRIRGEE